LRVVVHPLSYRRHSDINRIARPRQHTSQAHQPVIINHVDARTEVEQWT